MRSSFGRADRGGERFHGCRVYWKLGADPWARTAIASLPDVLARFRDSPRIVVLVQIDRDARFDTMVKLIDDLDQANLTRFSRITLTPLQKREVEAL